jgi:hypothetical protein
VSGHGVGAVAPAPVQQRTLDVPAARAFLVDMLAIAVPALCNEDATSKQQATFAGSVVRALDAYIDARIALASRGGPQL